MRIILLFLVVITIYWLIKRLFFKPYEKRGKIPQGETLVQCAFCQTHIPESTAIYRNDHYYCHEDHANKG